jgi:DNA repair exonuclease SbcCD ATPase subunit
LIAEEVEKVLPELVVSDSAGEVETVLYHEMPAMLLNELQKQQKTIEQQANSIERQAAEIEELKAEMAALRTAVAQQ